jgi:hypothetical protein
MKPGPGWDAMMSDQRDELTATEAEHREEIYR